MKSSTTIRINTFPSVAEFGSDVLLIFDQILLKNKKSKKFIESFDFRYSVQSGEKLKSIENFPEHIKKIANLTNTLSSRKMKIVVMGGGTVGDFAGFIASVFKRGVELNHIPSTWLAALDSAHGGKNGLNISGAKNQIGTFYPADKIYLIKELLLTQPAARTQDAYGEIIKMSLIDGGILWKQLQSEQVLTSEQLWANLPKLIQAKNKVVKKDPYEKSGYRHILNLGHTMGHVFESAYGLSHGQAVGYGLVFSLVWSRSRKIISIQDYEKIIRSPVWGYYLADRNYEKLLRLKSKQIEYFLNQDKKKTQKTKLRFIFIKKVGKVVVKEVSLVEIFREVERQKKLLKEYHA